MIFIGGGGGLFFALAGFVLLLLLSGGNGGVLFLLVPLLFFAVPILMFRAAARRAVVVAGPGGWQPVGYPPPQPPAARWEPPQAPVLPAVTAADVSSLRDRLGHDVRGLDPGADPVARQAMADASERYSMASDLLERARSEAQLRTAWLAAVEGLQATRTVRSGLGLDLGPPIPQLLSTGPALTAPTRIDVGGRTAVGAPSYEPGRPHWFPGGYYGGRHVPGGWYDVPFWPSALLLGGLGGWALGSMTAGAMYGEDLGWYGDGDLGDLGAGYGGDEAFGGYGGGGEWGGDSGGDFGGDFGGGGGWGGGGDVGGGGWDGGGGDFGGDFGGGGDW